MRNRILLLLFAFSLSLILPAQNQVADSILQIVDAMPNDTAKVQQMLRLAKAYRYSKAEGLPVLYDAYALSVALGDKKWICYSSNNLGIGHYYGRDIDSVTKYWNITRELAREIDDDEAYNSTTNNFATLLSSQGQLITALEMYQEALSFNKKGDRRSSTVNNLVNIAGIYQDLKKPELALSNMDEAEAYPELKEEKATYIRFLNNKAILYTDLNQTEKELPIYRKSLSLAQALQDSLLICEAYEGLASSHRRQGNTDSTLFYYTKQLSIAESINALEPKSTALRGLGNLALVQAEFGNARDLCQRAADLGLEKQILDNQVQVCDCLSKAYAALGNTSKAYQYSALGRVLQDSLLTVSKLGELTALRLNYDFENQKLALAAERETERAESALEIEKEKNTKRAFGIGAVALAAILLFGFRAFRSKQKSNKILAEKNEVIASSLEDKEILLKEIHHRVKNNLQVISSLLSIQSREIEDEKALEAVQESRNRVKSMAIIHQNLYSEDNLTGVDVQDYIRKLSESLFNSYRVDKGMIQLETDIDPLNLDVDTTIPLGLILNELLSNALKYAFDEGQEGIIKVALKNRKEGLELTVADNGKGLGQTASESQKDSFGIKMIKAFAGKLNAVWEITSQDGTHARMLIKNYSVGA